MAPNNVENEAENEVGNSVDEQQVPEKSELSLEYGKILAKPDPGDEVIITGLAGVFPDSYNVYHFRDNLLNKVDMVNGDERRWRNSHPEIPQRTGKIWNIEKFDNGFFGVHYRQADNMDPMIRIILEKSVEAIMDAGLNPSDLEGTRTGVFIGSCFSETERSFFDMMVEDNCPLTGVQRSMIPNRISYYLQLKGPSFVIDTACSSSLYAFEHAYKAIRSGQCDRALVGGSNLCLHPFVSLQFARLGVLSTDGSCKAFDVAGNGYARSEAICVTLLEKASVAKRHYGTVLHAKTNCDGYKNQGITYPSSVMQTLLLREFYKEVQLDPASLSFLEAHGTGTKVGDPEECLAIDNVFTENRDTPLLIGSVKSSIGHSEPSSGLCSITKCVLGMENNTVLPNLYFTTPREGVKALEEGRLKVVTDCTPFPDNKGLVGINSFGFGGGNCHVLLKWNEKIKSDVQVDDVPRIVCMSARTEEAINSVLDGATVENYDIENIALIHDVFRIDKIFSQHKSKLSDILDNKNNSNNVLGSVIVSLGIVDLLKSLKIEPDYISARNIGEISSAYFEECLNLEQCIGIAAIFNNVVKNNNFKLDSSQTKQILPQLKNIIKTPKSYSPKYASGNNSDKLVSAENLLSNITSDIATVLNNRDDVIYNVGSNGLKISEGVQINLNVEDDKNPLICFLESIGQLYELGFYPQVANLYPKIQYPVSRGTPMISPYMKWNHNKDWFVSRYQPENCKVGERSVKISPYDEHWAFVTGHVIDGRNLFPASGYLILVWETLAYTRGAMLVDADVTFENVRFRKACNVNPSAWLELTVVIQKGSGNFEVIEGGEAAVTGTVKIGQNNDQVNLPQYIEEDKEVITGKDIYKELRLRGYNYKGVFRGLTECNIDGSKGKIKWDGNYINFIDNMLQMRILGFDSRILYVPTCIERLTVNSKAHIAYANQLGEENPELPVFVYPDSGIIRSGYVEIRRLLATSIPRRRPLGAPVLEKYEFVPNEAKLSLIQSMRVAVQIALEEFPSLKIKGVELIDETTVEDSEPLSPVLVKVLEDLPLIHPTFSIFTKKEFEDLPKNITVEDKSLVSETETCNFVVGSNLLTRTLTLNQAFGALKDTGFIISREPLQMPEFSDPKIDILVIHNIEKETIVVLRKRQDQKPFSAFQLELNETTFDWVEELKTELKNDTTTVVFSQNEPENGILGFTNCLRREPGNIAVKCVFIVDKKAPKFDLEHPLYRNQLEKNMAINVYKNGMWGTYRHLLLEDEHLVVKEHCYANVTVRGDLSSMKWLEGPLSCDTVLNMEKTLVHIYYSALNFRDVMTASGKLNNDVITTDRTQQECVLGFEFSGRTSSGKRVMGLLTSGALATLVEGVDTMLWPVPDEWSLEEAATVPVVYGTAMYALLVGGQMRKGLSVLIHSGTGGVGQAAITLALHYGCKVFTTVGTPEKREFIKKKFPQLSDNQIGNSRDTSFELMIRRETKGRGVDLVLNSLADEKLMASVRCLATGGRFLEIGKYDLAMNSALSLMLMEGEKSYHGIMIDSLFNKSHSAEKEFNVALQELIDVGAIKPLERTIFKDDELEKAFRFMTTGKHMGKVLVKIRPEEKEKESLPTPVTFKAVPKFFCTSQKVHIIIGGLGGFGLELADWIVLRGARNLVLTSRTGIKTGYQAYRISIWKSYGVNVLVSTADVTTLEGTEQLIQEAQKLGEVESLFNLAVVLKDGLFENQTAENFEISFGPKAIGTKNLDLVTRKYCPNMRDFVIFSSVSCGRGNAGQTNYGMANSVMERICEKRKQEGYNALAVEWGAIGEVGLVAEMQSEHVEIEIGGTLQQRISSCVQCLDIFLKQSNPIVSSMVVAEKKGGFGGADNIVDAVANILGLKDLKSVSMHATLAELGMDSMTAVEIKQTLEREFDVFLTPQDIRSMTFARLKEIQADLDSQAGGEVKEHAIGGMDMFIKQIANEHDIQSPIVRVPSALNEEEKGKTVILFPGIEGAAVTLLDICTKIEAHTFCLQYCLENDFETLMDYAAEAVKHIKEHYTKEEKFNLIGYSFGGIIALEAVKILEQEGYEGQLLLIDSAPAQMSEMLKIVEAENDVKLQTALVCQIMSIHISNDIIWDNREKILMANTFDDRIKISQEISRKYVEIHHTDEYQRNLCICLYKRIKTLLKYKPTYTKLDVEVQLFKPKLNSIGGLPDDYNLSHNIGKEIEVILINGNHHTMLNDVKLTELINKNVRGVNTSEEEAALKSNYKIVAF